MSDQEEKYNIFNSYDKVANWYEANKLDNFSEKEPFLSYIVNLLDQNSHILDLGCGTGVPIAKYFYDLGYKITAIDGSFEMIKKIKHNLPHVYDLNINMLDIDKELNSKFDAIIMWDSLFHLSPNEQKMIFA